MYEDIGTLLGKGFNSWKRNLNLAIPFVLNVLVVILLAIAMMLALFIPIGEEIYTSYSFAADPTNMEDVEDIQEIVGNSIGDNLITLAAILLISALLMYLVTAFFTAGAIGMAQEAIEKGRCNTAKMWAEGKKHYLPLFIAEILMFIVILVVIAALSLPFIPTLISGIETESPSMGPMIIWIALIIIFSLLLSLAFAMVPYALVIDGMKPIAAIKEGINFFRWNKMDVFLVWLVIVAISVALGFLSALFSGSELASAIWQVLSSIINIVVIAPLSTIWWVRLYLTRTKKIAELEEIAFEEDEEVKYL